MRIVPLLILTLSMTACLKTRSELQGNDAQGSLRTGSDGRYVSGNMDQQQRAQIDSRFFEIDRDFRQLYGKIELLEKQVSDMKGTGPAVAGEAAPADKGKLDAIEKRLNTVEEALIGIDKKLNELSKKAGDKTSSITKKPEGPFGWGEHHFENGDYAKAIESFDEYRKKYPKGRRYADATLKMGVCFQRLKMPNDAKAFYKEVIQRYPNTKVSNIAEENLKKI